MIANFKDLEKSFPPSREYSSSSNHLPLTFFDSIFPISKTIDIWLGYFTTNSFRILSLPIAEFIHNGGKLRIIACHHINSSDYKLLFENDKEKFIDVYDSVDKIKSSLDSEGQHFFDCLKFLIKEGKLEIKLVKFKDRISHDKKMLFYDGTNYISTIGSLNFTLPGIIWNGESFRVIVDWGPNYEVNGIEEFKIDFEKILSGNHKDYREVDKSLIKIIDEVGDEKELNDLLETSFAFENTDKEKRYNEIFYQRRLRLSKLNFNKQIPSFPYPSPRPYQIKAYQNWLRNNKKGLFAMATGTGKTLTALNIVLSEYFKNGFYRVIILVPTDALVSQWIEECNSFRFQNIFSSNDKKWREKLKEKDYFKKLDDKLSYIFISTYASFLHKNSLPIINSLSDEELLMIVDEAHGIGTQNAYEKIPKQFPKRIGLSATPDRKNHDYGNDALNEFFHSNPPFYTFNYSLLKAINDDFLTPYRYYPKFVKLTESELKDYADISLKLLKHFDFNKMKYRKSADILLILRKNIINKASNKLIELENIFNNLKSENNFKHTVVFVPEGFDKDDKTEDGHQINQYTKLISTKLNIRARQFGKKDREIIIDQFKKGILHVLTAMKTLDEGVDIPEIKRAIFCSSTGNPRQYVQRRGRILRKPKSKNFKKEFAEVFDMIVYPNEESFWNYLPYDESQKMIKMEKNIFRNEMFRVINFLYAADNITDLNTRRNEFKLLVDLCYEVEIDIFNEIEELKKIDEN